MLRHAHRDNSEPAQRSDCDHAIDESAAAAPSLWSEPICTRIRVVPGHRMAIAEKGSNNFGKA